MADLKQRLHRKNSSGSYDTVHLETSSEVVVRPDGTTVETSLTELKTSVSEGKALVAAAVTDKGVTTAADATFATMAENIGNIQTGVDINGIIKEYEVYAGDNISAGDFVNFLEEKFLTGDTNRTVTDLTYQYCIDTSSTEYAINIRWTILNNSTVVLAYFMYKTSSPNYFKLYSQTLTVTDNAITPHTPILLQTTSTSKGFNSLRCIRINDNKFGILFREYTGSTNEQYLYFKIYTTDSSTVIWSTTLGTVYSNSEGMMVKEIVGYNNLPELLVICQTYKSSTDSDTQFLNYYTIRNFTNSPTVSIKKSLQIKCDFLSNRSYVEINNTLFGYLVFSQDNNDSTNRWHLLLIDTTDGNVTITDKGKCYFDYNIWQNRMKTIFKNGDKNQYTLLYETADSAGDVYQLVFKLSDNNDSIIQTQTSMLLYGNTSANANNMYFDSIKVFDSTYAECFISMGSKNSTTVGTYGEFSGITYCSINFDDNGYITSIDKLAYILSDFIFWMTSGNPQWKEFNGILFWLDRKIRGYGNNTFIAGKINAGEMVTKHYCKSLTDDTISGVALESGSSGEIIKAVSPNR